MVDKLKKINEVTFAELKVDNSKPLEWRRSLQPLDFQLTDISIQRNFSVCHTNYLHDVPTIIAGGNPEAQTVFPQVTDALSKSVSIVGIATPSQGDTLFIADGGGYKTPEDDVYTIKRPELPTKVILRGVNEPSRDTPALPNCKYRGSVFWGNARSYSEDRIEIRCEIPADYLQEIIAALSADPSLVIDIGISAPVFTYEVDDVLREHWMPRQMIFTGWEVAVVTNINVAKSTGVEDSALPQAADPPLQPIPAYVPLMRTVEQQLSQLTIPLWIISGLLLLHLLK